MEQISPTRMNLLALKRQLSLAEQGLDLLKKKRDALLAEFFGTVDAAIDMRDALESIARDAMYSLVLAKAHEGTANVRSASFAGGGDITVDLKGKNVMGVYIPSVGKKSVVRSVLARGYSLSGVSCRIDEVANMFEKELNCIIEVAGVETKLRRLGDAIQKTSRRVNALDYVLIPRLKQQANWIRRTLEEREREDIFRLKRMKKRIERRKFVEAQNK